MLAERDGIAGAAALRSVSWQCGILCAPDPAGSSSAALTPSHNISVCAVDLWVRFVVCSTVHLRSVHSEALARPCLMAQTHEFALDTVNTTMALHGGQCRVLLLKTISHRSAWR